MSRLADRCNIWMCLKSCCNTFFTHTNFECKAVLFFFSMFLLIDTTLYCCCSCANFPQWGIQWRNSILFYSGDIFWKQGAMVGCRCFPNAHDDLVLRKEHELFMTEGLLMCEKLPPVRLVSDVGFLWPSRSTVEMLITLFFSRRAGRPPPFCAMTASPGASLSVCNSRW